MAQTRALGMHEKVWNQRKNIQSHPTEVPGTVPPRIVLAAFLSCTVPCLPLSHIRLLGWTSPACCYPDAAGPDHSSSPDAAYELNPFFPLCVLTPSLFYLPPLHLPFRFCRRHTSNYMLRTKGRTCRSRSPVVRCTWFWAETANTRAKDQKKKKKAFIIDFLTLQSSERALGCVKPTFLIKSPVVTFDACASGEQSFRPFLKPCNVGLIKQRGWILPLSPEKLSFFHDF